MHGGGGGFIGGGGVGNIVIGSVGICRIMFLVFSVLSCLTL